MSTPYKILDDIAGYEFEFGFKERVYCSQEETKEFRKMLKRKEPLPDGVFYEKESGGDSNFFRIKDNQVSADDKSTLLMYQNAYNIRSIKRCVSFITGLIVAGLIAGVIALLIMLSR